jgi:hypothetical protein
MFKAQLFLNLITKEPLIFTKKFAIFLINFLHTKKLFSKFKIFPSNLNILESLELFFSFNVLQRPTTSYNVLQRPTMLPNALQCTRTSPKFERSLGRCGAF